MKIRALDNGVRGKLSTLSIAIICRAVRVYPFHYSKGYKLLLKRREEESACFKNIPSYEQTGNENRNVVVAYLKKKIGKYISNKT